MEAAPKLLLLGGVERKLDLLSHFTFKQPISCPREKKELVLGLFLKNKKPKKTSRSTESHSPCGVAARRRSSISS